MGNCPLLNNDTVVKMYEFNLLFNSKVRSIIAAIVVQVLSLITMYVAFIERSESAFLVFILTLLVHFIFKFLPITVTYDIKYVEWGWGKEYTFVKMEDVDTFFYTLKPSKRESSEDILRVYFEMKDGKKYSLWCAVYMPFNRPDAPEEKELMKMYRFFENIYNSKAMGKLEE